MSTVVPPSSTPEPSPSESAPPVSVHSEAAPSAPAPSAPVIPGAPAPTPAPGDRTGRAAGKKMGGGMSGASHSAAAPSGRSLRELLRTPEIAVAMICAMVAYALMNLVMTSTPLAMVGCGYDTGDAANVVSAHIVAMFAPAFFTGHLITRFGARRVVAARHRAVGADTARRRDELTRSRPPRGPRRRDGAHR